MTRIVRIGLVAILAVTLALLAYSPIKERGASHLVEEPTASPTEETGSGGESATDSVQTTEEDPVASGAGRPTPGSPPARRGSSSARGVQSAESHPPDADSPSFETAGPPVSYTDQADDAYGRGDGSPNAEQSQREFDILRVDWGPVSGGYSTSITVAGSARSDGEYYSEGQFDPARTPPEGCWLTHFLTPGTTAFANAYCEGRFVGRVEGGPVASTPTTSGGTRLTATFDNRTIPPEFEAARTLHNLAAWTHAPDSVDELEGERSDFLVARWLDYAYATSGLTYRV